MKKRILVFTTLSMALAVALDAIGSHLIQEHVTAHQMLTFNIAARYHVYHSLAILALTAISYRINSLLFYLSCYFFLGGIFLFSGSLYILSVIDLLGVTGLKGILVPATPMGGFMFILAWILASAGIFKGKTKKNKINLN